ncbi:hypothetical protein pah_c197o101 [Parachlamydia acanthamoebae str. Hall's coccus]|nr:hypothetical protein pah_c197o101 [Parachlamydia acanthamoebae str. Hall's coccus]
MDICDFHRIFILQNDLMQKLNQKSRLTTSLLLGSADE